VRQGAWWWLAVAAAMVTLAGAVGVIVFGALATSGFYGSRMAWFLGVAVPFLAISMLLSGLAGRAADGTAAGGRPRCHAPASAPAGWSS
jgi:hypothetical protein